MSDQILPMPPHPHPLPTGERENIPTSPLPFTGEGRVRAKGQATTEVVLLMPLFMFFLYAFAKIFAMLLLVQKLEIASYYAARRWQLESHRNATYAAQMDSPRGPLQTDITQ